MATMEISLRKLAKKILELSLANKKQNGLLNILNLGDIKEQLEKEKITVSYEEILNAVPIMFQLDDRVCCTNNKDGQIVVYLSEV